MPSNYWLKLYHEMLNDPKMIRLSDRLYRRTIELFLLAGDYDQEGDLPPLTDMAIYLRLSADHLETDLVELASVGIVSQMDGEWNVTNFSRRQAAMSDVERQRRKRDRKRKGEYYSDGHEPVTKRETDRDIDLDKETDRDTPLTFKEIQKTIETLIGIMPNGKAGADAIDEIEKMGAAKKDIENGVEWLKNNTNKTIRYYGSLVGPTRTAMAKRIQDEPAKKPEKAKVAIKVDFGDGIEERKV